MPPNAPVVTVTPADKLTNDLLGLGPPSPALSELDGKDLDVNQLERELQDEVR